MPCFSPFVGETAAPDEPAYMDALSQAQRLIHMIDCYLVMNGFLTPSGKLPQVPGGGPEGLRPFSLPSLDGAWVHRLAQHCLCDGVGFYDVYEMVSVLDSRAEYLAYKMILLGLAGVMRAGLAARPYDAEKIAMYWPIDAKLNPTLIQSAPPKVMAQQPSGCKVLSRRWLTLNPDARVPQGHSYPLLERLHCPGGPDWSHLLFSLMAYLSLKPEARVKYEAALLALARLVREEAGGPTTTYGPRLGPVERTGRSLRLEADGKVLAALADDGGALVLECYRPLCLAACNQLLALGRKPNKDGSVGNSASAWEHAMRFPGAFRLSSQGDEALPSEPLEEAMVWSQLAVARIYQTELGVLSFRVGTSA